MFAGGIVVAPLVSIGDPAIAMSAVVAGGAVAALLATVLMTRQRTPAAV